MKLYILGMILSAALPSLEYCIGLFGYYIVDYIKRIYNGGDTSEVIFKSGHKEYEKQDKRANSAGKELAIAVLLLIACNLFTIGLSTKDTNETYGMLIISAVLLSVAVLIVEAFLFTLCKLSAKVVSTMDRKRGYRDNINYYNDLTRKVTGSKYLGGGYDNLYNYHKGFSHKQITKKVVSHSRLSNRMKIFKITEIDS